MSGTAVLLRQRNRQGRRDDGRLTRAASATALRGVALQLLRLPQLDDDGREAAGRCLELVGEMETLPRCGWYPHRPRGWRP